ncbi:MAG: TatD family hydrolase [Marinagarivorans sp.]|nr:TatD family hydrolase [Marinagarivorans sp.]
MPDSLHFIDSHCHVDFPEFDADRDALLQRARALGVSKIIVPGVEPLQWPAIQQLSTRVEGVYWSAGLHPWWLERWLEKSLPSIRAEFTQQLDQCLSDTRCVAVGECGLDAGISMPMEQQISWLMCQLEVAKQHHKPVILHCYKAHNALLECLRKVAGAGGGLQGGVLHGFSGSHELAQNYWRMNIALGVGGTITYPRANKTRQTVAALPREALVLETDAPSMPLMGAQGQRNSPESVPTIAACLAQLRGETLAEVAAYTSANAVRIFNLL